MEIDQLYTLKDHEAGAEMQLSDANGKKLDMFITVVGLDSRTWRNAYNKSKQETLSGKKDSLEILATLASRATIAWRGFTSKGKELPYSKEKAKQLYMNAPYIIDQVDDFITNRANFTRG